MGKVAFDSVCLAICELSLHLCRSLHTPALAYSAPRPRRAIISPGSTCITWHFSDPPCFISPLFCFRKLIFPTYFSPIICSCVHSPQPQPRAGGRGAGGKATGREGGLWGKPGGRLSEPCQPHEDLQIATDLERTRRTRRPGWGWSLPASCIRGDGLCDCCVGPCAPVRWELQAIFQTSTEIMWTRF